MSSLNRATLIGNVGQAPEIRSTADGRSTASFSLATNERWVDKQSGEKKERTEWHRIVVFNERLVDNVIDKYVAKGSSIFVEGKIQTRKWTDNNGVERYSTEIVISGFDGQLQLLGGRAEGSSPRPPAAGSDDYGRTSPGPVRAHNPADLDDEIPF